MPTSLKFQIFASAIALALVGGRVAGADPAVTTVVALSDQMGIKPSNRGFTPSSSLTVAQGKQIGQLMSLMKPGTTLSTVQATGSMKPIFDEKAVLLLEDAPFESLKVGDIVLYRHPQLGVAVAHRLVIKEAGRFWSKGDANGHMDNVYVTKANYLKRVFAVIYTNGE